MSTRKKSISPPIITYGNQSGTYFTEWRMDLLRDFLRITTYAYGDTPPISPQNINMWYDEAEDYHCLSFEVAGQKFMIRLYKIFSLYINGERKWGVPRSEMLELAAYIRKLIRDGELYD